MSLLIRKALGRVEGIMGHLTTLPHDVKGWLVKPDWSWSGWSRSCLTPFQSVFISSSFCCRVKVTRPGAQGSRLPSRWWVMAPTLSLIWTGEASGDHSQRDMTPAWRPWSQWDPMQGKSGGGLKGGLGRTSRNHFQPIRNVNIAPAPHVAAL